MDININIYFKILWNIIELNQIEFSIIYILFIKLSNSNVIFIFNLLVSLTNLIEYSLIKSRIEFKLFDSISSPIHNLPQS